MLIVLAKATLDEGALEPGRAAIAAMVKASRSEEGCLEYTFAQDVLDPTSMIIVEKWRDEAALAAHFATPHMAAFQQALAGLDVTITEALKYEAADGAPVM